MNFGAGRLFSFVSLGMLDTKRCLRLQSPPPAQGPRQLGKLHQSMPRSDVRHAARAVEDMQTRFPEVGREPVADRCGEISRDAREKCILTRR